MQPYSNATCSYANSHPCNHGNLVDIQACSDCCNAKTSKVSDFSQRRSLTLRIVWGLWSLRRKFACICCMSWVMMVVMMMSVMQNAVMVFLQMWLFPVFVMILLWFCFLLFIDRCHNIWDFKMHKKGTIFILFRLVFFIFIVENFLCPKVKKGHFCL